MNDERRIIFIPHNGEYIEILGHKITWTDGWEEFLNYLKRCALAIEKATPKKPIQLTDKDRSRCPNCKNQLPFRKNALKKQNPRIYCDRCGQAIDWSE